MFQEMEIMAIVDCFPNEEKQKIKLSLSVELKQPGIYRRYFNTHASIKVQKDSWNLEKKYLKCKISGRTQIHTFWRREATEASQKLAAR